MDSNGKALTYVLKRINFNGKRVAIALQNTVNIYDFFLTKTSVHYFNINLVVRMAHALSLQ